MRDGEAACRRCWEIPDLLVVDKIPLRVVRGDGARLGEVVPLLSRCTLLWHVADVPARDLGAHQFLEVERQLVERLRSDCGIGLGALRKVPGSGIDDLARVHVYERVAQRQIVRIRVVRQSAK